ncbi:zinc finger protein 224-like [Planococcus citri]|uniref:zinc finger protein 224-like n=1 Tax=Planococcus citri TaxID=170843 RepID=UPI0031F7F966
MKYIYKYEDSMRQCEILHTENVVKLSEYSKCLLQSSSISSSESTGREKEHEIMEKLDTVQETITTLKADYNDLTQHYLKSTSFGINFKKKFFNYLARQETLRKKFIKTINECKQINSHLINILRDCFVEVEALNENCNQNTSIRGGFDLSSIPKVYVLLPKLDLDCHPEISFSIKHAEEVGTSPAASVSESLQVSSSDLNTDVAVKKCNSTTVLVPKKSKNCVSSKRNEISGLSQSLVCKICHWNASNEGNMKRHIMFLHEGLRPFECADCGKSFTRKEHMKSHIFSMHMPYQSRPYKCDTCSKFYSTRSDLNYHRCSASARRKKVSDRRQSFVCNICPVKFSRPSGLKSHMLIHEGLKPFKCAECGKLFRRKYHMNQHIRLFHSSYHTRSYKCDICSKRFAAQFRLNAHKRLAGHCSPKLSKFTSGNENDGVTVEKHDSSTTVLGAKKVGKLVSSKRKKNSNSSGIFVCDVCHRNFSRRQHLKRHLILHEASKQFKCSKCDRPFTRTDHLKRHMLRVHVTDISDQLTLDSYYHCAHCKYRCRFKESLVYHIKRDHISDLSLEEFSCTVCGKTFMNRQNRLNHERCVHVEKNVSVVRIAVFDTSTIEILKSTFYHFGIKIYIRHLLNIFTVNYNIMKYIFKYEDSIRQCETILTENMAKLSNYSEYLLQSSSLSSSESTEREEEYEIMKMKLDTAQENIATLKSEYNDLTLNGLRSSSFENNFKETFFKYLARQETLRLKFIEIINVCRQMNSNLDDILRDCSVETLNENGNQNTSKSGRSNIAGSFNLETNSFSNERVKEFCTSAVASASSKSLEVSSSDLNSDVAVKKCDSTIVLETKKSKNSVSSKRSEIPNLSQSQSLVCNICHRSISKKHMRRHVLLHEGLKPFECADCGKSFARKENMKLHIFSMHLPYESRPYGCDTCSKFYSTQDHLNNHRCSTSTIPKKVSDRRRSLVCNICRKRFSRQQSLKRHRLIHEDPSRRFACNICHWKFSRQENLKRHLISHEASKPFKCSECDRSFRRTEHVKRHMRLVHVTDIRNQLTLDYYFCGHCKYQCQSKETLVYHIKRDHISDLSLEEFSCTICGKTFSNSSYRRRHEQTVHAKEKCFCCTNCGNRYKYDNSLAQHLRLKQCMPK